MRQANALIPLYDFDRGTVVAPQTVFFSEDAMARKKPRKVSEEDLNLDAEDMQSESDLDMMTEERRIAEYQVEQDRDPGDWMANSIKDAAEMNIPDEVLAGEEAIDAGADAAIAQSALDLLRKEHTRITDMFSQYRASGSVVAADAQPISEAVCRDLAIHNQLEQEIFYPAVRAVAGDDGAEFLAQSHIDHDVVERLITDLRALAPGTPEHDDKMRSLIAGMSAHIEQEETMLFPLAEERLGDELVELGREMQDLRNQITLGSDSVTEDLR
ncbi:MAG: hemerythrin domain-containing protein [Burkholderiales bacterium]